MGNLIDAPEHTLTAIDEGIPLSHIIRRRLENAGARFHANDNIAAHLRDGELDALQNEVAQGMEAVLRSLVIDVDNDHNTRETSRRVAKMFIREVFAGRYDAAPSVTEFPNVERLDELLIVGPLRVRSACSHHLCPIMGRIWIGVLPSAASNLIGLSKYGRLVNWVMTRPQIQEEAVKQIADLLESRISPDGLAVVLEAEHFCMHWRGTKDDQAKMTNSVMRGKFLADASLRREFLALLSGKNA
ncbi:GTP cyclohydrolase I [Burkholderia pseudomultivorans]|uniref:GTP cyclohydrolase I n=1 Tax=Burkholderia TaxID=32008 RepID=UPI0001FDA73F|nr:MULTISPECIES: GTP cyclohydrolase I [Burkholderia]EGD05978.1 GTP cyclohydrolase I [Burkholderia sp. TJI49]AOI90092.1 GTP cyclohydrolase [Burkholderia pseudomultivorans]KVA30578.1 GTP cyclohydrolase [Burkholderia cepacia]KVA42203.1 GTP cyclohydrolase [Burkholderia cepacia]KVC24558.1 GTP cyclohydrolase [Burkholderia pseudomultivorans]